MIINLHPRSFTVDFEEECNVIITSVSVGAVGETSQDAFVATEAIWDTGAEFCMITRSLAEQLQLFPIAQINVRGVNHEERANLYLVDLQLPHGLIIPSVPIAQCEALTPPNCSVLIGMSIIKNSDFCISHKKGHTVFSFRKPSMKRTDYVRTERWKDRIRPLLAWWKVFSK